MDNEASDGDDRLSTEHDGPTAAERFLTSLAAHDVRYVFTNLGTDHTPLLEATGRLRRRGEPMPELVICPHEFVAISAAHGYAAVTGDPQGVLVHVDVGTLNLGCGIHNAMRANAPVFIMAGLAPVSEGGLGGRHIGTHYKQDVFDQPGIVSGYCKWVEEYRVPADPDAIVSRGLTRARTPPGGPVYVSIAREAWESRVATPDRSRAIDPVQPSGPDPARVTELVELIESATAPLVITSKFGAAPRAAEGVSTLVSFAETAGAGVVEHIPAVLSFPRDHDHHVGFVPAAVFDEADLVILAGVDIPWVPARGSPRDDAPVIQIDIDPSKTTFPYWDFRVDYAVAADPIRTIECVTDALAGTSGAAGRKLWERVRRARDRTLETELEDHKSTDRLTPRVASDLLQRIVTPETILMDDVVTNSTILQSYCQLTRPGSYHSKFGAGLGWGVPAPIGAKLAAPAHRILAVVGDGTYMLGHPAPSAWLAAAQDAPVLWIVYNNQGWNAVKRATDRQHPAGASMGDGVPESQFEPAFDLAAPATIVDAYTTTVRNRSALESALKDAVAAIDGGKPAVIDVKFEPI